jgi:Zn-finger nucleic acid-binding protein
MTRISDRARFCHRCAKPIAPQGEAGAPTKKPCPSCGARHKMLGRRLGEPAIAILECTRCAGVWLSHDAFDHVRDHARETAPPAPRGDAARRATIATSAQGGALYRRCPECRSFMNRRNYGRGSGIVIDDCKEHGIWFDARELENLLGWIRQGGEARAAERASADHRERERNRRIALDRESRAAGAEPFAKGREATGLELIRGVLGTLFDL